jgi:hypothetical protein
MFLYLLSSYRNLSCKDTCNSSRWIQDLSHVFFYKNKECTGWVHDILVRTRAHQTKAKWATAINEFGIKYWTLNPVWVTFQEHVNIEEKVWLLVKKCYPTSNQLQDGVKTDFSRHHFCYFIIRLSDGDFLVSKLCALETYFLVLKSWQQEGSCHSDTCFIVKGRIQTVDTSSGDRQ